MSNLYLVGFMGAGKSVAGRVLAERLGRDRGDRPLWSNEGEARRLWQARRPHYLAATWTLALDGSESPAEVAERVAALVPGAACAT